MKQWLTNLLRAAPLGAAVRGRVHRVSIVQGGEVSVVLRFGVEEASARGLNQGSLIELREIPKPAERLPNVFLDRPPG